MPHGDYRSALLLARYAAEAGLADEARRAAARVLELKPDFTLNLFETKLHPNFHPDLMRRYLHHLGGPRPAGQMDVWLLAMVFHKCMPARFANNPTTRRSLGGLRMAGRPR